MPLVNQETTNSGWGASFWGPYNKLKDNATYYWQKAKDVFNDEGDSLYIQALQELEFKRYQGWRNIFHTQLRNLKAYLTAGDMDVLQKTLNELSENIQSRFDYQKKLNQLAEYTKQHDSIHDIFTEALCVKIEESKHELKQRPQLAEDCFYDDLINHIMQFAGKQISEEELKVVCQYYQDLVDNTLYNNIYAAIESFLTDVKGHRQLFGESEYAFLPNRIVKSLIQQVNNNFRQDESIDNTVINAEHREERSSSGYNSKDLILSLQQGIQTSARYIKENPKVVIGVISTAVAGYFFYRSTGNITNAITQLGDVTADISWDNFPIAIQQQGIKFVSNAIPAYGISALSNGGFSKAASLFTLTYFTQYASAQTSYLKTLTGSNTDYSHSIARGLNNEMYAVGNTDSVGAGFFDISVKILYEDGSFILKTIGGPSTERGYAVRVAPFRPVTATGYTYSQGTNGDVAVIQLDENGSVIKAITYGGPEFDQGRSLALTNGNGTVVTGSTKIQGVDNILLAYFNQDLQAQWGIRIVGIDNDYGRSVIEVADGFVGCGYSDSYQPGGGLRDLVLFKVNKNGSWRWGKAVGSVSADGGLSVYKAQNGDLITAGWTYSYGGGDSDFFISRFDANGDPLWHIRMGGVNDESARAIRELSTGNIVFTGYTDSNYGLLGFNGQNVMVVELTPAGSLVRATLIIGGSGNDQSYDVEEMPDGIVVTGDTEGFSSNSTQIDAFFARLNQDGVIPNCPYVQDITSSVNVISITPAVNTITPSIQQLNFTEQLWPVSAITQQLPLQTECEDFAPSSTVSNDTDYTATENALSSSRADTNSQLLWLLLLVPVVGISLCAAIGAYLFHRNRQSRLNRSTEEGPSIISFTENELPSKGRRTTENFHIKNRVITAKMKKRSQVTDNEDGTYYLMDTVTSDEAKEIKGETGFAVSCSSDEIEFSIGQGAFGKIGLAFHNKEGYVVYKKIVGEQQIKLSQQEAELQRKAGNFKCENVLPIYNTLKTKTALYHFMPLAGYGNGKHMQQLLIQCKDSQLKAKIIGIIAHDLLTGIRDLHGKAKIYHLDLKLENILFTQEGELKITDFGCAQQSKSDSLSTSVGDTANFSPDRSEFHHKADENKSTKGLSYSGGASDCWATGIMLFELLTGKNPFTKRMQHTDYYTEELSKIQQLKNPAKDSIWHIIKGLLTIDPKQRLSAEKALQQTCFTQLHQKDIYKSEQKGKNIFTQLSENLQQNSSSITVGVGLYGYDHKQESQTYANTPTSSATPFWGNGSQAVYSEVGNDGFEDKYMTQDTDQGEYQGYNYQH